MKRKEVLKQAREDMKNTHNKYKDGECVICPYYKWCKGGIKYQFSQALQSIRKEVKQND